MDCDVCDWLLSHQKTATHTFVWSVGFCFVYRQNLALSEDSLMDLSVWSAGVTDVSPGLASLS